MSNKFIKRITPRSMTKKGKITTLIIVDVIYVIVLFGILLSATRKGVIDKTVDTFCYDNYDIFTDSQEQKINESCKWVQNKYGINVYVSTCKRIGGYATENLSDFLYEHDMTTHENIVVIIINCNKENSGYSFDYKENYYHFDIYTPDFATSAKKITDSEIDKILYSNSGNKIAESKVGFSDSTTQVTNGVIGMTKDIGVAYSGILSYRWAIIFIIATGISALIAFIVIKGIKKSYSKKRDNQSYSFSANTNLNLTVSNDVYSHKNVTSVYINRDSGSHGSGHSSGGGGGFGHRGGR